MFSIVLGKEMEGKEEQPRNALWIVVTPSGISIADAREEQSRKASYPISFTLLGIFIDLRAVQPLKAYQSIVSIVFGRETYGIEEQPSNAYCSIVVTPSGISIEDVREEQLQKA